MPPLLRYSPPTSKLQYVLWGWCLFTAAWYLFVTVVVVITGDADFDFGLYVLLLLTLAGPVVFAWGCLAWTTRPGWIVRCLGIVLMIVGFYGLSLFAAVIIPFFFFCLPSVWRFKRRTASP